MSLKQGSSLVTDAIDTPSYYKHHQQPVSGLRKSLSVHKVHPFEKMNLKIRSVEKKINGVGFNVDLQVKTNTKLEKVVDLFCKRTGLGRVFGLEEEV